MRLSPIFKFNVCSITAHFGFNYLTAKNVPYDMIEAVGITLHNWNVVIL